MPSHAPSASGIRGAWCGTVMQKRTQALPRPALQEGAGGGCCRHQWETRGQRGMRPGQMQGGAEDEDKVDPSSRRRNRRCRVGLGIQSGGECRCMVTTTGTTATGWGRPLGRTPGYRCGTLAVLAETRSSLPALPSCNPGGCPFSDYLPTTWVGAAGTLAPCPAVGPWPGLVAGQGLGKALHRRGSVVQLFQASPTLLVRGLGGGVWPVPAAVLDGGQGIGPFALLQVVALLRRRDPNVGASHHASLSWCALNITAAPTLCSALSASGLPTGGAWMWGATRGWSRWRWPPSLAPRA